MEMTRKGPTLVTILMDPSASVSYSSDVITRKVYSVSTFQVNVKTIFFNATNTPNQLFYECQMSTRMSK